MKSTSSMIALVAALCLVAPAFAAGVTVNAGTSTEVSAGAGGVSVDANAQTDTSASADAMAGDASSSMAMDAMSSSQAPGSQDCANTQIGTAALDTAALATVTDVTVFKLTDCASVPTVGAIDGSATAALQANAAVQAAITASGETGAQIVGYMMDGASLTVYVTH
ncbi:MAG: hypothetical protein ABI398_07715 [Devosia sp.]